MGKWNKDRYFYGYKGEALFQDIFPTSKKLVNQCDFELKDYFVEIGRSRMKTNVATVYYRKLFYNLPKNMKTELKDSNPNDVHKMVCEGPQICLKDPSKVLFVYFNNNLKYFIYFTYEDVLLSPLKRKRDGEYYFKVQGSPFIKTTKLYKTISDIIGLGVPRGVTKSDFGYTSA